MVSVEAIEESVLRKAFSVETKNGRRRMPKEYYASAAKKARAKRRDEQEQLMSTAAKLKIEISLLQQKKRKLESELEIFKVSTVEVFRRYHDQHYKKENEILKTEIEKIKAFSNSLKFGLESFWRNSNLNDVLLQALDTGRAALNDVFSVGFSSINWPSRRCSSRFPISEKCTVDVRFSEFEDFYFREDLISIPVCFEEAKKSLIRYSNPNFLNEALLSIVQAYEDEMQEIYKAKIWPFDGDSASLHDNKDMFSKMIRFKKTKAFADEEFHQVLIKSVTETQLPKQFFPHLGEGEDLIETVVFSLSSLPGIFHQYLPNMKNQSRADDMDKFLLGIILTKGEDGTSNVTFIQRVGMTTEECLSTKLEIEEQIVNLVKYECEAILSHFIKCTKC